ncbi:MAG: hypothetical protein KGJ86_15380, partial [Chloroflexota bacterium]|nr:hypothetical protein [Chloroflexota bacterium]
MIYVRTDRWRMVLTPWCGIVVALSLLTLAACGGAASPPASSTLAPAPDYAGRPTIDGIPCETTERVNYHVHSHLAVFV